MPKMTSAILGSKKVNIEVGLRLRDESRKRKAARPNFQCDECGQALRPHKSGGHSPAHFEHYERNSQCSQSHIKR